MTQELCDALKAAVEEKKSLKQEISRLEEENVRAHEYQDSADEVVRAAKAWAGGNLPEPLSIEGEQLLQAVMDLDG